jgi:hypothetical protein
MNTENMAAVTRGSGQATPEFAQWLQQNGYQIPDLVHLSGSASILDKTGKAVGGSSITNTPQSTTFADIAPVLAIAGAGLLTPGVFGAAAGDAAGIGGMSALGDAAAFAPGAGEALGAAGAAGGLMGPGADLVATAYPVAPTLGEIGAGAGAAGAGGMAALGDAAAFAPAAATGGISTLGTIGAGAGAGALGTLGTVGAQTLPTLGSAPALGGALAGAAGGALGTAAGTAAGSTLGKVAETAGSALTGAAGTASTISNIGQLLSSLYGIYQGTQTQKGSANADPFAPYREGYAKQLQGLMTNPSSVTSLPGYKAGLDQAEQTLTRQSASQGLTGSGATAAALAQLGGTYETNFYNNQIQTLAGLAGAGSTGAGGAAQMNTGGANTINSSINNLFKILPSLMGG